MKCTNQSLKPKHHNLIYYASVIMQSGPIVLLFVIRLEGFHKALKKIANAIMSRKNVSLSIATRHQLCFAIDLWHKKVLFPLFKLGQTIF